MKMTNIVYQKAPFTREELIKKVQNRLSEKRFAHVLRVEKAALSLAEKYQVNLEQASIAALVHDYAKEISDEDFIKKIKSENLDVDLLSFGNAIWHGVVGQYFVAEELGICDQAILQAVASHTTGSSEMSDLDKVIYIADYIEEGRDFPGVKEARQQANISLDAGVSYETYHTIKYLLEKKVKIYPKTIETYNRYVART